MEVYCFMTHLKIIIEEIVECMWKKGRCDSVGIKGWDTGGRYGRGKDTGHPGFLNLMMCVKPCGNLLLHKWILKFDVVSLWCSAFWFCHNNIGNVKNNIFMRKTA